MGEGIGEKLEMANGRPQRLTHIALTDVVGLSYRKFRSLKRIPTQAVNDIKNVKHTGS